MNLTIKRLFGILACFAILGAAVCQEAESFFEDDLFAGDEEQSGGGSAAAEPSVPIDIQAGTLGVRLSGYFSFSAQGEAHWSDLTLENIWEPESTSFSPALNALISIDARPDEDFRVKASFAAEYPFLETAERPATDIIRVNELFADWDWNDALFFRTGKSSIHWGTGYFYSPADVLNLAPIDPEDPDAEREGPLSVRAHVPVGVNNVWAYLIVQDAEELNDIAAAAKGELLIGNSEWGLGAFYKTDVAPRLVLTATLPIWRSSWYAEAVVSRGSDRRYVVENESGVLGVERYTEDYYLQATAGFRFDLADAVPEAESVVLSAQYYFDGTGYEDSSILLLPGVKPLIGSGELLPSDLKGTGMHYVTARLVWADIFDTGFGANALWSSNLGDASGRILAGVSLELFDRIIAKVEYAASYGDEGDEFTPFGPDTGFRFSVNMGSGRF